jgi:hypothetical protein
MVLTIIEIKGQASQAGRNAAAGDHLDALAPGGGEDIGDVGDHIADAITGSINVH